MRISREEALATLEEGHRQAGVHFARMTDEQLSEPATIGGGDWSAKDLLGHIASWEEYALRSLDEWRRGERPWVEDVFRTPDGVDLVNSEAVLTKSGRPAGEVRGSAETSFRELTEAIASMSDEDWNAKAFYETERRTRLRDLLGSITGAPEGPFGHAFAHMIELEDYAASLSTNP